VITNYKSVALVGYTAILAGLISNILNDQTSELTLFGALLVAVSLIFEKGLGIHSAAKKTFSHAQSEADDQNAGIEAQDAAPPDALLRHKKG